MRYLYAELAVFLLIPISGILGGPASLNGRVSANHAGKAGNARVAKAPTTVSSAAITFSGLGNKGSFSNSNLKSILKGTAPTTGDIPGGFFSVIQDRDNKLAADKAAKEKEALEASQSAAQANYTAVSIVPPVYTPLPPVVIDGCGDNEFAHFIYMKESGCSTTALNSQGCYGIGQDCNNVLQSLCGADYACENAFFTNYANARYGGWADSYQFWLLNSWW